MFIGDSTLQFDDLSKVGLTISLQCVQGNNPRSFSFKIQTIFPSTGGYIFNDWILW